MNLVNKLKQEFNNSSDLIIRQLDKIYVIYLESICDSNKINFYILRNISQKNIISGPNTIIIKEFKDIIFYLVNGFTIVIKDKIYAVETRGNIIRSVEKPDSEPSVYGPKDAFNENIQINLGLIKRRIKSTNLINDDYFIGTKTKTKVSIIYLKDIVQEKMINKIKKEIASINKDSIISIGNLKQLLGKENRSFLPTIMESERPDNACTSLLEGKIIILCDNSPFCLILPAFFSDFINPVVDNYGKNININFLKILRFICLIFTIIAPALYISLINFDQELVPITLLRNFAIQRNDVAFPSWIEALIMLIVCGILKESDMRFPSSYGSAISIVGALILGEAAVSAGLISPIMIIVVSLAFISSLVFTDQELVNGLRYYRFLFLLLSSLFGLIGLVMGIFILLIHVSGLEVLGKSYAFPVAPFSKTYFNKTIFKKPSKKDYKKDTMLIKGDN
ncbi:MAG: spore germination protein [Bacilli bacterium]|nr:spore germination protein [Bacilli bacterium]